MSRQQSIYAAFFSAKRGKSVSSPPEGLSYSDMAKQQKEKPSLFEQLKHKFNAPSAKPPDLSDVCGIKTPSERSERPSFSLCSFSDQEKEEKEEFPLVSEPQSPFRTPASKEMPLDDVKRKFVSEFYDSSFEDRLNGVENEVPINSISPVTPALQPSDPCIKRTHKNHLEGKDLHFPSVEGPNKRRKFMEDLLEEGLEQGGASEKAKSKFDFLDPSVIRDNKLRRPDHPLYDKRTLHIPKETLNKMSASQRQYWETKRQYMDAVLFFKVGKFYELYELDAEIGQREFDWKMTISGVGKCKQVGVPESGIEDAIQKLLIRGYKVGRMEQIQSAQARAQKGSTPALKRELVQVLTPSTIVDDVLKSEAVHLLSIKEEVIFGNSGPVACYGFAFVDAGASKIYIGSLADDSLRSSLGSLLMQVSPRELIYETGGLSKETLKAVKKYACLGCSRLDLTALQPGLDFIESSLVYEMIHSKNYFKGSWEALCSDSINRMVHCDLALCALGGLVAYLQRMKLEDDLLRHGTICAYEVYRGSLRLDGQTISNLEIFHNNADGSQNGTLFKYLNHCSTFFGKRLLRRWLCHPLQSVTDINNRLDAVEELLAQPDIACTISQRLRKIPDLERLVARIKASHSSSFVMLGPLLGTKKFKQRVKILSTAVKGFKEGIELLKIVRNVEQGFPKSRLLLEASSLCCINNIKDLLEKMETIIADKFSSDEKCIRQDISQRSEGVQALSSVAELFLEYAADWSQVIDAIGSIDVLLAFTIAANSSNGSTCRPTFISTRTESPLQKARTEGAFLSMKGLWHPYTVGGQEHIPVPNDINLGNDGLHERPRAMLLTGPNMGGKSTILRATCLAVLMAQLGCYAPCEACVLSPVDIIFTRLGATDHIMSGESTFFVECMETAAILRYATGNSLVVLDELGRGTSTFDGYAIAYAVLRHLVERKDCRLLFATHYHPLTKEFSSHPRVSLYHMACSFKKRHNREEGNDTITKMGSVSKSYQNSDFLPDENQLVFLYKLCLGASPESYGLQVALLAGMPKTVVESAFDASQVMKSCLSTTFKASELRREFSSMHEQWLSTILATCNVRCCLDDPSYSIEDLYDNLICLWLEMKRYSSQGVKQKEGAF